MILGKAEREGKRTMRIVYSLHNFTASPKLCESCGAKGKRKVKEKSESTLQTKNINERAVYFFMFIGFRTSNRQSKKRCNLGKIRIYQNLLTVTFFNSKIKPNKKTKAFSRTRMKSYIC